MMIDVVAVPRRRAYRDDGIITATTVVVVVCGPSRRRRRRDDDSTHDNGPFGIIENIVVVRRPGRDERTTRPSSSLPTMDDVAKSATTKY
jgi:hypothetical protein